MLVIILIAQAVGLCWVLRSKPDNVAWEVEA